MINSSQLISRLITNDYYATTMPLPKFEYTQTWIGKLSYNYEQGCHIVTDKWGLHIRFHGFLALGEVYSQPPAGHELPLCENWLNILVLGRWPQSSLACLYAAKLMCLPHTQVPGRVASKNSPTLQVVICGQYLLSVWVVTLCRQCKGKAKAMTRSIMFNL